MTKKIAVVAAIVAGLLSGSATAMPFHLGNSDREDLKRSEVIQAPAHTDVKAYYLEHVTVRNDQNIASERQMVDLAPWYLSTQG
ncbi:MAG: hypothetical protein L0Z68_06950 [Gammaproteobacteria bacterium]|nr:hypothetical protein [Gammaproteobacteria bacterium]